MTTKKRLFDHSNQHYWKHLCIILYINICPLTKTRHYYYKVIQVINLCVNQLHLYNYYWCNELVSQKWCYFDGNF